MELGHIFVRTNLLNQARTEGGGSLGSYEPPLQYLWQTKIRT